MVFSRLFFFIDKQNTCQKTNQYSRISDEAQHPVYVVTKYLSSNDKPDDITKEAVKNNTDHQK